MDIKIYGSRGTTPFSSRDNTHYGGNTSCIRISALGQVIILDCGSGLNRFQSDLKTWYKQGPPIKLSILLSHLHLDHIIGLSIFSPIIDRQNDIRIFTKSRSESPLTDQVFGVFKPPYWPVDLAELSCAQLIAVNDNESFTLADGIKVTPFPSFHYDETTAFRIDADKSLVYLLDCELDDKMERMGVLAEYCQNADLIIFDSAYLPEDYAERRGWGHSTYEAGLRLAEKSGCGKMIFCHLSHEYSDQTMDRLADKICSERFMLAYDGMEMSL